MKLSFKLPAAFALSLTLLFAAALFGIAKLNYAVDVYRLQVMHSVTSSRVIAAAGTDFSSAIQEWKNVLLRGKNASQREKYWNAHLDKMRAVQAELQLLQGLLGTHREAEHMRQLTREVQVAQGRYAKAYADYQAAGSDFAAGDASASGADRIIGSMIIDLQTQLSKEENEISELASAGALRSSQIAYAMMVVVTLAAMSVGFWLSRQIVVPLLQAVDISGRVARGDLTNPIQVGRPDEIGALLEALDAMQQHLAGIVRNVRQGADNVSLASAEIAAGNYDLSVRTENQASSLGETAGSMQQLGTAVSQGADNARRASDLAHSASAVAVRGGEIVNQVVDTMEGIHTSSSRIADIISVIDGIAFQTNILALNAAVEAARAGAQGRGFAVVASEVRALAGRSAEAAKEIKTLINTSVERVKHGSSLVGQAGAIMREVVDSIQGVAQVMVEISSAGDSQKSGVGQMGLAINELDLTTQQNSALVEQMAAAASSLKTLASDLVETVAVFRLAPIAAAAALRVTAAPTAPDGQSFSL